MAGFNPSTLANQLNLPFRQATESLVTGAAQSLVQKVTDFASASPAVKQAEALLKLGNSGIAGKFGSLTPGLKLGKSNGDINAVDAATNSVLGKVGSYRTQQVPASMVQKEATGQNNFKVIITQSPIVGGSVNIVEFDVMPTISEGRTATYDAAQIIHHPGEILKYKSTNARTWSVKALLISRTSAEAEKNRNIINTIRSWVMPFYGVGTEKTAAKYLGAPPPILTLKAYGDRMIGPVKCVLEQYDWTWPNDVDYIPTATDDDGNFEPFPVVIDVTLTLKESFSPAEYSGFDIVSYRQGDLSKSFTAVVAEKSPPAAKPPQGPAASPTTTSRSEPARVTPVQAATATATPRPPTKAVRPVLPPNNVLQIDIGANTLSDLPGA